MKNRKRLTIVLAIALVLSLVMGTMAYFTDHIVANTDAVAGSLDLTLTTPLVSKTDNFKPGEGISISFTLANDGNKSADVLETIVLTSTEPMTGTESKLCEFELYLASDVTVTDGVAKLAQNAQPIAVRSVSNDGTQVTYAIPQFVLNGTGTNPEIEPEANDKISKESSYVLVFHPESTNNYQDVTLTLDYEAQAKQHRNTGDDTWAIVKTETVTFAGNTAHQAVPALPANP